MYLQKDRNSTYYTRLPLPKTLRERDFPDSIRVSLRTKDRQEAIDKNLAMAQFLRGLIRIIPSNLSGDGLNGWLIPQLKHFQQNGYKILNSASYAAIEGAEIAIPSNKVSAKAALEQFIGSKSVESISHRTVTQLKLRVGAFVDWLEDDELNAISTRTALQYRDYLLSSDKSYKTQKDYLAAAKQFCGWCVLSEFISVNPFLNIKHGKKPVKASAASDERSRWSKEQLLKLFAYTTTRFAQNQGKHKYMDYFVPLLSLFAGLRISEACQLGVDNFLEIEGVVCMKIDHADETNPLKTANAYRTVPVHSALIRCGLLEYVAKRRETGHKLLFNYKPSGIYREWSKSVSTRFYHILKALDLGEGNVTLYGLRHTFVDELQQREVSEHIVAELVGHSKQNITFGRYGKKLNLPLLKEKIEKIPADLVGPFSEISHC